MNSRRRDSHANDMRRATTSRRALLTASGAVAICALSGCLSQVASSVTSTGSSPAAVFAGPGWNDDDTEVTFEMAPGSPHVARLTPTVAGRVELEGWVTSTALTAANYNNSRSNKSTIQAPEGGGDSDVDGVDDDVRGEDYNTPRSNRSIARPSDLFDDDVDEDDETARRISRLEAQLQEATTAAVTAISKRSARTGRNPETEKEITEALDDMEAVLAEMRAVLERCSDESCVAALENVEDRDADVRRARDYSAWDAYDTDGSTEDTGTGLLVGDYLLPPAAFDPSELFSPEEQVALYRYLEQRPVVTERFSVCLPDAEVPGGSGSIEEEVTPERFIDYIAGRAAADGDGKVYAWGSDSAGLSGPDETGDCDDDDSTVYPGAVCGTTPHFVAEVTGPVATGGSLEVVRGGGTVTVVNTPPTVEDKSAKVCVAADDDPCGPGVWARTTESGAESGVSVYQTMVQPPRCPRPFPALLYVQRCRSNDQLVYTGGWVIDDAALYEESVTVLSMAGPTEVIGMECCFDFDSDADGFGDLVKRSVSGERARRGARIDSGTVDELVQRGVLSESQGNDILLRKRPGGRATGDDDGSGEDYRFVTHVAVDAPVLHLVSASRASQDVKFKAGAELSKGVN